ncbi:hypothetical protein KI659_17595 [Litoribacter alkaliphilus]|uniref:Uncharacterized protein n=1 Tax=Litoribacter ruber TaxID=702568 RepID=A0AAP2CLC4_9BACT|nr:hypothetical protein [Litoribacter alkaliphilus]MBS9525839.1 hypothetical protein [Litoribacter alkaliphilus]
MDNSVYALILTVIISALIFRPGLWHLILFGIWQALGMESGEATFIILMDVLIASLIFYVNYSIMGSIWKIRKESQK